MNIIIITNFSRDFSKTDNNRFLYLAKTLAAKHNVEIVTSDFFHGKKIHRSTLPNQEPFKVTFLHEPGYKKNICLKRFWSHSVWGRNVKKYLKNKSKPDLIYCAVPSLSAPLYAAKYCKKNNVRFIIDIQDLWPEAFQMIFDPPAISKFLYYPFFKKANKIYRQADEICAVSKTYAKRAQKVNNKCKNTLSVFLGTDLSEFDKYVSKNKKNNQSFTIAYIGTLGHCYDIKCVIDAINILQIKKNINNIRFLIMGDGPLRKDFESYAKSKKINAKFTGKLPYHEMVKELSMADLAINPITKGAAQSIINKVGDYAAAGLPILNTEECEEYRKLITKTKSGININNSDAEDLAKKIEDLYYNKDKRIKMGQNSRKAAEQYFDRATTYKKIIELIENINV